MTEPNVLGNISPAKFLFDSGNTEIINLFRDDWDSVTDDLSLMKESAGTLAGVTYVVPANHVFYLLSISVPKAEFYVKLNIQSNTSPDTSTGGTTKQRIYQEHHDGALLCSCTSHPLCIKFVAGEYVTPYFESAGKVFITGWGVECDA